MTTFVLIPGAGGSAHGMIPEPGETAGEWWAHTGATEARDEAARVGGYGPFDVPTYFLHDVDAELAAEGEHHQRDEAEVVFGSVCDFTAWPAIRIRVLVGADDRFFPIGLQRRVARERLGVEADVFPGAHRLRWSCRSRMVRHSTPSAARCHVDACRTADAGDRVRSPASVRRCTPRSVVDQ